MTIVRKRPTARLRESARITKAERLKPAYPWFGTKGKVADAIWQRFGDVGNYVEPFCGSASVLLARPRPFVGKETLNDVNAWLANFLRAAAAEPDEVARLANRPVVELDIHAAGTWLFYRDEAMEFVSRMRHDLDYYCVKSAALWLYGQCNQIGDHWNRKERRGRVVYGRPSMDHAGAFRGFDDSGAMLRYLRALQERLRCVRIFCGDWRRALARVPTIHQGRTAIMLDPPYGVKDREHCYGADEDRDVAANVREWAIANEGSQMLIALCGYAGEHRMPKGWKCVRWKPQAGFGALRRVRGTRNRGPNRNAERERVWFSPGCEVIR